MAAITIQVIQGHEAGRVLRDLNTPITIGREEENEVQLNDERISRFHAKIQGNEDALILTDLDSTNGTRVNGHYTKMRVLQTGDQVAMGRCVLVIGSPEDVALLVQEPSENQTESQPAALDDSDVGLNAFPSGAPDCPTDLTPRQAAEIANVIEFTRTEVLAALNQIQSHHNDEDDESILLPREAWHRLQSLPGDLSRFLDQLSNPSEQLQ